MFDFWKAFDYWLFRLWAITMAVSYIIGSLDYFVSTIQDVAMNRRAIFLLWVAASQFFMMYPVYKKKAEADYK